jgi:glucose-1-phosphate thymidylyltransferase
MKAIIPVAGFGTRLRPHTYVQPKVLLHVADRPILAHVLDELVAVGIDEVVLVVGYLGDKIEAWTRKHYAQLRLHLVLQEQAWGNGHAVYVAREHLDGSPALVIFGDTIIKGDLAGLVRGQRSLAGVKEVKDPRRLGVVELDAAGLVRRLVEKPEHPPSNLALIGAYFIKHTTALRAALERLVAENRQMKGEFWLADALQLMIDGGEQMGTFPVQHWYDCGTLEALLEANRDLLKLSPPQMVQRAGSVITPPSFVHPSAVLERAMVGPHASISEGARIVRATVRDSIIGRDATIENCTLEGSIVGEGAVIKGVTGRVNVGDSSTVEAG